MVVMTDTDRMTAARLRDQRKRRGWTQAEMARRAEVSVDSIRHWEAGRRRISRAMTAWLFSVFETK